MKKNIKFIVAGISIAVLAACTNYGDGSGASGKNESVILIEESFKPLFETSIDTFEGQFPKYDIAPSYLPEGEIIEKFYTGDYKTICISRQLTSKEVSDLKKKQIEVRSDKVAVEGIALITNPENKDSLISISQLKRILNGTDTVWPQLKTRINVVFDQENSANFYYLKNLCKLKKLPVNVFAVKGNQQVIDYVKKNKSALGIIGVNWISDADDFDALAFLNGITVMSVSKDGKNEFLKPYASYLFSQDYPLSREIWMINFAGRSSVFSSFVNFMIGEKGQLIVQKSALVPANAPIRLIQLDEE
jgi:phosphate transport system substrate-binding protein